MGKYTLTEEDRYQVEKLQQYTHCNAEIETLLDEISRWRSLSERVTSAVSGTRVQGVPDNRLQQSIERVDNKCAELLRKLDILVSLRGQIERLVDSVKDLRLRQLLQMRYISGMTFERIAVETGKDYRWTLRLHARAIKLLDH